MFTNFPKKNTNESVYRLGGDNDQRMICMPPIYRSIYADKVRIDKICSGLKNHSTMGRPSYNTTGPCEFLRKHSRAPRSPVDTRYTPAVARVCKIAPDENSDSECVVPVVKQVCFETPKINYNDAGECENTESTCLQKNQDFLCKDEDGGFQYQEEAPPKQYEEEQADNDNKIKLRVNIGECVPCEKVCLQRPCKERTPRICCNIMKTPVPKVKCSKPATIPRGDRNFIRANAVRAVRTPGLKPVPRVVYTANGDKKDFIPCGYARVSVETENFGKIPNYILQRKQELLKQRPSTTICVPGVEPTQKGQCRLLEQHERDMILCGLKKSWEEVFRKYLSLSLAIDNRGKLRRKTQWEKEMKSLEEDIRTIQRHDYIFVGDAEKSFYF